MKSLTHHAARIALALGALLLLGAGSLLLGLASLGVFATSGAAWTSEIHFAGVRGTINVIGVVRLATLPGVIHLLDGRVLRTPAGTLRLAREDESLRVRCAPCVVQHRELASHPVVLRSVVLDVRRDEDRLQGLLVVDEVGVAFEGRLHPASVDLAWTLPPTELAMLYRALAAAVPEAAIARIEGRVRAAGTLSLPSRRARVTFSGDGWDVSGLSTEHLRFGPFRFACNSAGSMDVLLTGDGEKRWVAGDAMGPYLPAAVIAAEDQRFSTHTGYDERAIGEILADIDAGRPDRGASTITQQLARTLFTGGERTAARKLRELLYAIEMERTLGKGRILELYLNTVDWGPGICGAKAAARTYFNKTPARLTPLEAAWLASILRNPHTAWAHQFTVRQPDRDRATQVLMQMRDWPKRERKRFATHTLAFAASSRVTGGALTRAP